MMVVTLMVLTSSIWKVIFPQWQFLERPIVDTVLYIPEVYDIFIIIHKDLFL